MQNEAQTFHNSPDATSGDLPSAMLTVAEFATHYRVSVPTAYRLHDRGDLPFVKIGRSTRIRRSDAEAWAAKLPVTGREAA